MSCGEPVTLGTCQKQEVKVGDATGSGVVQLWEQNIGLLAEGRSYELKCFRIVEYENIKSIAMCWKGSKVLPIEDLKNVVDPPIDAAVVEATASLCTSQKLQPFSSSRHSLNVLDVGLGLSQLSAMR